MENNVIRFRTEDRSPEMEELLNRMNDASSRTMKKIKKGIEIALSQKSRDMKHIQVSNSGEDSQIASFVHVDGAVLRSKLRSKK